CPMRVGVVVIQVIAHLLDNVTRHLRAAWAVEISNRITIVDAFESGEVFSNFGNRRDLRLWLTGSCGHLVHHNKRPRKKSFRLSSCALEIRRRQSQLRTTRDAPLAAYRSTRFSGSNCHSSESLIVFL